MYLSINVELEKMFNLFPSKMGRGASIPDGGSIELD